MASLNSKLTSGSTSGKPSSGMIDNRGSTTPIDSPTQLILDSLEAVDKDNNLINKSLFGGNLGIDLLKKINFNSNTFTPFVNGYYYVHMQNGTWPLYFDGVNKFDENLMTNIKTQKLVDTCNKSGSLIFGTDLPNLLMETETVSGRLRNLNYATKMQLTGDFSINYHDTANLDMMTYHVAWFKYIEALRRGDIHLKDTDNIDEPTNEFIPMPYYNAMWVLIFKPFTVQPIAIFKLMGVTPINLPFQSLLGDRGAPALGIFNQTFKCNDIIFDFIGDDLKTDPKTGKVSIPEYSTTNLGTKASTYLNLLSEFTNIYTISK